MKYKYNGQWVDLSIKALDSMPVGSQIEYTGTDIPTGWEQVNDYSTTEVDTGKKWTDGSKIYRLVVNYPQTLEIAADSWVTSGVTVANIDVIIEVSGVNSSGATSTLRATHNSSGNITVMNPFSNFGVAITDIILEYTKAS